MEYGKYGVGWRSEMTKFRKWELIDLLKKALEATTNSTAIDELKEDGIKKGYLVRYCLGCDRPIQKIKNIPKCMDCPAGTCLKWHPHLKVDATTTAINDIEKPRKCATKSCDNIIYLHVYCSDCERLWAT